MQTKLIRNAEVIWEELDGEALLIHSGKGERWTLNGAALAVWKLCGGKRSLHALAQAVSETSGCCLIECRDELLNFAQLLCASGLLRCAGASGELALPSATRLSFAPIFQAIYLGKGVGGPHRRPSPRGNSGPG